MDPTRVKLKLAGVLALTAALVVLVCLHIDPLNGPWYWEWPWRRLAVLPVSVMLGLAAVPVLIGVLFAGRTWLPMWAAILVIMLGSLAMRLASALVLSDPMSLDFVRRATADPLIGSYYSSAAKLAPLDGILAIYWEFLHWNHALPHLDFHAINKPPGPVLYHLIFIRMMGDTDAAALWSGMGLGILATFSIPCTYLFTKQLTENREASLVASAWLAICPGFVLFFPMTDPVYPIFTCLLSLAWFKALRAERWHFAAIFGLGLFAATFVNYSFLVIGVLLAGMILIVPQRDNLAGRLGCGLRQSFIAAAVCVGAYLLVWFIWSFNPLVTFFAAYKAQVDLIASSPRSQIFPWTIPWDLYDFLLGAGWIAGVVACFWFLRRSFNSMGGRLALLAAGQILITAFTGLLQAETARVWNFLLPLLLLPVGMELAGWKRWKVVVVLACVIVITIAIHMNMTFINEG